MPKIKNFYYENKAFLIISVVTLLYYIPHLIGFRLGMIYEESRDMNAYLLSLQGYLPYRDFEWIYGPFSFFIYPFIMKAFGINLIILRISYIIFASLVIPLTYFLARRIMPHLWAGAAAFLSAIFFDAPYYTYNHVFVVLSEISCLLMVSRFIESKKIYNLFLAGIFSTVALLTKPLLSGFCLFMSVSLYLLIYDELGRWQERFRSCLLFMVTTALLGLPYFLYFYYQTKFKNIPIVHSFFAPDSALLVQAIQINFDKFSLFLKRFAGIFPINKIINMASFTDFKQLLYAYFDDFIFCLSFIPSIILIFLFIIAKLDKTGLAIKEKIYQDNKFLLLFIIFSIFISLESTIIIHPMGKAYTTQISFILAVYIFYFLKRINFYRWIITIFFVLFLFYIAFFNFYRFPYSIFKRYRKFTAPLNLSRAKGVFVTWQEKELYESLSVYLSSNLEKKEDKIVVIGYYPQFSFLTGQKNIFADHEYIFEKLRVLLTSSVKRKSNKSVLTSLENELMFKLEKERPKFILDTVLNNLTDNSLRDSVYLTSRVKDYIARNYSLDRVFGPADVFGLIGSVGWVNLYKLKGR